jgi:hypothetical protein
MMHKILALFAALVLLGACNGDKGGDTSGETGGDDTAAM